MNEIEIKDYFKLDDSHSNIRGFVKLTENGKDIFVKENMIVKTGREAIALGKINCKELNNFLKSAIGDNRDFVNANDDFSKFGTIIEGTETNRTKISSTNFDELNLILTLKIKPGEVKNEKGFSAYCLGLYYEVKDETTKITKNKLFSRVSFPEVLITPKNYDKIIFTYYIYF